jgi:hypothetical protein
LIKQKEKKNGGRKKERADKRKELKKRMRKGERIVAVEVVAVCAQKLEFPLLVWLFLCLAFFLSPFSSLLLCWCSESRTKFDLLFCFRDKH